MGVLKFVLPLALLCAAPAAFSAPPARKLRIACNLPLTGDLATYGGAVREGIEFALEQMASEERSRLEFDWQDNQGQARQAASIMQLQLRRAPDVYMSGVRPQTMAIWSQVGAAGLPHFVWIFDVSIATAAGNNFRTYVSFKHEPGLIAAYAAQRQARRVAIVYVQVPHTDEAYEGVLVPQLNAIGIEALLIEKYELTRNDFKDIALKVKAFRPDLLFISGFQANLVALVPALATLHLIKADKTIASYDLIDTAPLLPQQSIEGLRVTAPSFMIDPANRRYQTWKTAFTARYHAPPLYTHAFAFDLAAILADVHRRLAGDLSREKVTAALRATRLSGITGPISFDADGDLEVPVELAEIRAGIPVRSGE